MRGRLILCATPIGNLEDISQRALRTLEKADVVACEDTRRTRKLLTHYGISVNRLTVYNEGNERRRAKDLLRRLTEGATVVLVSDAGMPGLSDPGYRLVRECIDSGVDVDVVPGPTAVVTAVVVSGLPPGRFVFEGFLPRKPGDRRRKIAELSQERRTIVIFAAPHRIDEALRDLLAGLGNRQAALVRELTKMHQEIRRGTLEEILEGVARDPPRGEIVLVVGGAVGEHRGETSSEELARQARELMDSGVERREAMARVARSTGVARRRVFDALVEERSTGPPRREA